MFMVFFYTHLCHWTYYSYGCNLYHLQTKEYKYHLRLLKMSHIDVESIETIENIDIPYVDILVIFIVIYCFIKLKYHT